MTSLPSRLRASLLVIVGSGVSLAFPGCSKDTPACNNPSPLLRNSKESGLIRCDSGEIHRARSEVCDVAGAPEAQIERCIKPDGSSWCGDCSGTPAGVCTFVFADNITGGNCMCRAGCTQDSDCAAGSACVCATDSSNGKLLGSCAPAKCRTDADCKSGRCLSGSLSCVVDGDECTTSSHCSSGESCLGSPGSRECNEEAVSGRPLLLDGSRREAPLRLDRAWG